MTKSKSHLRKALAKVLGKASRKTPKKSLRKVSDKEPNEAPSEVPVKLPKPLPVQAPEPKSKKEEKLIQLKAKKKELQAQLDTTLEKFSQTERLRYENDYKFMNWWQQRTDIGTQAASELAQLRVDDYKKKTKGLVTDMNKLERECLELRKRIGNVKIDIELELQSDSSDSSDLSEESDSSDSSDESGASDFSS